MRMGQATVRPFEHADIDRVCSVLAACAPDEWQDLLRADRFRDVVLRADDWRSARAFAGEVDGTVEGFAALVPEDGHAFVAYLHVRPARRGLGLGARLLDALEEAATELGCVGISTCGYPTISPFFGVDAADSRSTRFFERRGYRERSRSLHRRLRLDATRAADARPAGVAGYRLSLVRSGDADYWAARRGIVRLCAEGEAEWAGFAATYGGRAVDVANAAMAVAWSDDRLIGFCGFVPGERPRLGYEGQPQCGPLLVHPDHRGRGIASALHQLALAALGESGCATASLGSDAEAAVVRIHDRLGFETIKTWVQFERSLIPEAGA